MSKTAFDPDKPVLKIRTGGTTIKHRLARIAKKRSCDPTSVAREGVANFVDSEESRLGLPPYMADRHHGSKGGGK